MLDRIAPCSLSDRIQITRMDITLPCHSSLSPPDGPVITDHDLRDTVARIARRIGDQAIPLDGPEADEATRHTWEIRSPDPEARERRSRPELASGLAYQGSAGIAYFLAQAGRSLDDPSLVETAKAGFRHALDFGQTLPEGAWGLHSGRVGIAWTVLSSELDDETLEHRAWALLEPMSPQRHPDQGLDVIAGAAGAIPPLLDLRSRTESDERRARLRGIAEALGDHLLATAHQEPMGWSWPTLPRSSVRHLVGFAHGTAGIAVALYELALATGRGDFRFAADMALVYESQHFQPELDNWPDLRNVPLGELLRGTPRPRLQAMARAGTLPRYSPTPMAAWCHGSPGVALSRLRLWQLTGIPEFLDTARRALRSTQHSLRPEALAIANYSLCHGACGNAEPIWMAAQLLEDEDERESLRQSCVRVAAEGRHAHELTNERWPCGTFDGASDPSLMMGEAGIGLFFLRLLDPKVPSPLLILPSQTADELPQAGYRELAKRSIDTFFAGTLHLWQELGSPKEEVLAGLDLSPGSGPPSKTPATQAFERLQQRSDELPPIYADAFTVEREIYQRTAGLDDFTAETIRSLARSAPTDLESALGQDPGSVVFNLAPDDALVITEHDWQEWITQPATDRPAPEPSSTATLLIRRNHRLVARRLEALPAVILQACQEPVNLEQILEQVAEALAGAAERSVLEQLVRQQVLQLYRGDLLDAHIVGPPQEDP